MRFCVVADADGDKICNSMPAAGGYTAMDIPHNTLWEIKKIEFVPWRDRAASALTGVVTSCQPFWSGNALCGTRV
jgi:hypothetical protein